MNKTVPQLFTMSKRFITKNMGYSVPDSRRQFAKRVLKGSSSFTSKHNFIVPINEPLRIQKTINKTSNQLMKRINEEKYIHKRINENFLPTKIQSFDCNIIVIPGNKYMQKMMKSKQ